MLIDEGNMSKNSIVSAEIAGSRKTAYIKFNELSQENELDWDYIGMDNPAVYFSEKEAVDIARSCRAFPHIKNVTIVQPLANDEFYILDYTSDEVKYRREKSPYSSK